MIQLDNVSYRYPTGVDALNGVSALIPPGIHLLLGENGAGKTTLLHILAGLLFPTTGSCTIDGREPGSRNPGVLSSLFFLGDNISFPQSTVNRFAAVHSVFYPDFSSEMFAENLRAFGLTGNERYRSLSLGMKRKSVLAYALALRTRLLLLDEPTNGLDIGSKEILRQMILRCVGEESTLIVSTHTVGDLETLYDGVIMLHRSSLLLCMPTETITSRVVFSTGTVPAPEALFFTPRLGLYHSISPADGSYDESAVDFNLLYFALQSPAAPTILKTLTTPSNSDDDNE